MYEARNQKEENSTKSLVLEKEVMDRPPYNVIIASVLNIKVGLANVIANFKLEMSKISSVITTCKHIWKL